VGEESKTLQLMVENIDYSDYLGRLAIGRVFNGTLRHGDKD
jgi:GTP-binding protein